MTGNILGSRFGSFPGRAAVQITPPLGSVPSLAEEAVYRAEDFTPDKLVTKTADGKYFVPVGFINGLFPGADQFGTYSVSTREKGEIVYQERDPKKSFSPFPSRYPKSVPTGMVFDKAPDVSVQFIPGTGFSMMKDFVLPGAALVGAVIGAGMAIQGAMAAGTGATGAAGSVGATETVTGVGGEIVAETFPVVDTTAGVTASSLGPSGVAGALGTAKNVVGGISAVKTVAGLAGIGAAGAAGTVSRSMNGGALPQSQSGNVIVIPGATDSHQPAQSSGVSSAQSSVGGNNSVPILAIGILAALYIAWKTKG